MIVYRGKVVKAAFTIPILFLFIANLATADHCLPGCHDSSKKIEVTQSSQDNDHHDCHSKSEEKEKKEQESGCDMQDCWMAATDKVNFIPVLNSIETKKTLDSIEPVFTSVHFPKFSEKKKQFVAYQPRPPSVPIYILIQRFII